MSLLVLVTTPVISRTTEAFQVREDRMRLMQTHWDHYLRDDSFSWAPVAHDCNPSYSGGSDQEDRDSKPAQANSSMRPYFEKTHHKKGLVE
jgi:hypothetical protein